MLRFFVSTTTVFSLLFSICLLPQTASARRCGEKDPETLLSLYQDSDGIYTGTFEKTVEGGILEATEDYKTVEIKHHFTISSALKGEARKFLVIDDREFRYDEQVPTEPEPGHDEESFEDEYAVGVRSLKDGDTVLLFIRNNKEGSTVELADYADGVKKLSVAEMQAYTDRINELNSIFGQKEVNAAHLLEWVIRTTADPITRWEGAYELLQSVRLQMYQDQIEKETNERGENGPSEEEMANEGYEMDGEEGEDLRRPRFDTSVFPKMLSPNQKEELANILLQPKESNEAETDEDKPKRINGDRELIELVATWKDPRLAGFLLQQLRAGSADAEWTSATMTVIAEVMDDGESKKIASRYADYQWYADDEEFEDMGAVEEAEPVTGETGETSDEPEMPARPERESDDSADSREKPEVKKLTYAEFRSGLVEKFIARCDMVIAERAAVAEAR